MRDLSSQVSLLEALPDAMLLLDKLTRICYLNAAAKEVFGGDLKHILGYSIADVLARLRVERGEPIFWQGAPGLMVVPLTGRLRYYDVSIVPYQSDAVPEVHQVVVMRDVTQRQEVRRTLEEQESFLRGVFEALDQPIFVLRITEDDRLVVVRANEAFQTLCNTLPKAGDSTSSDVDRLLPEISEQLRAQCEACITERQPVERHYAWEAGDQSQWWAVVVQPLANATGQVYQVVGTASNITRLKAYEADLRKAKNAAEEAAEFKSSILANMSHEIRTPLTGIIGFASILAEEISEEHREFAELISNSGRRLLNTLNSVLDYAKLESGNLAADLQLVNINETVADTAYFFTRLAESKGLTLEVHLNDEALMARLDPALVDRIVTNLVGNAVKFTEAGSVTVALTATPDQVELRVKDTGPGMHPSFLPKLFTAFSQESKGLTRSHQGTGLGLMITKQMVEVMQGTIDVESTLGSGSCFTVQFPRSGAVEPYGKSRSSLQEHVSVKKHAA